MNGELAQLIALAAHGRAWLAGRSGDEPPDLEHGNSTFQYVRSVRFELPGRLLRAPTVSSSVSDWFLEARRRDIRRLLLATTPERIADRNALGFAGAVPAVIVAASVKGPLESWRPVWTVGEGEAADRRIWDVLYHGTRDPSLAETAPNVVHAIDRLTTALRQAADFARANDLDEWAAVFEAALALDRAADPVPPFHPDMFPSTAFGRPSRRLLSMATRAMVFGGMGSWNDLGFHGTEARAYEEVSDELLAAVLAAFVAAVNGPLDR